MELYKAYGKTIQLKGSLLKNSSKPIKGFKYKHPFDGHGYINKYKFTNGNIHHRGIRIQTKQYIDEKKLNKMIYRGLATNNSNLLNMNNFSNISVIHFQENTYSMSEGGLPYKVDLTNNTSSQIENFGHAFLEHVPYLPLTVHPVIEGDKIYNATCFNCGCVLYNNLEYIKTIFFPKLQNYYFHDFKLTDNYYIFYLNALSFNVRKIVNNDAILDCLNFRKGNVILLVNKETLEEHYVQVPSEFDFPSLHIARVIESENRLILSASLIKDDNFDISNIKTPYEFDDCFMHNIVINLDTFQIDTVKQICTIHGEMPVNDGENIYYINDHQLVKINAITMDTIVQSFVDEICEEPCVTGKYVILITHAPHKTYLYFFDKYTLEMVSKYVLNSETSYGFHGTYVNEV